MVCVVIVSLRHLKALNIILRSKRYMNEGVLKESSLRWVIVALNVKSIMIWINVLNLLAEVIRYERDYGKGIKRSW